MIPKIYTVYDKDAYEKVVSQFARQHGIDPSHIIVVRPEKEELTVDQIHLMQKDIQVAFSKTVLIVLLGVDDSSAEVQNSLLKCLEEDSERILFLFLVKNSARLLPTILSRCSLVETKPTIGTSEPPTGNSSIFSFQKNTDVTKNEALDRIDQFIQFSSLKDSKILRHILQIRKLIADNNMNPILALDTILIFLSQTSRMSIIHEK